MTATVIYDGECPFCSQYVKRLRLEKTFGGLILINARVSYELCKDLLDRNINLDEGMVLILDGQYYHGEECIHKLALMSSPIGLFNKLNYWIFRSPKRTVIIYPLLKIGRSVLLLVLGKRKFSRCNLLENISKNKS